MPKPDRRTYHTLDGMRGIAALFVVARHIDDVLDPLSFPNSFVAVDLFFVLSGFVIASAYDERLRSGTLTAFRFVVLRLIRLWPVYGLGTALGLVVLYARVRHGTAPLSLPTLHAATPFALLMLPSIPTADLSPASAVAWTLFYELLINVAYAALFRWIGVTQLVAVAAIAAAGVVAASLSQASLDSGWAWQTSWIGLARVGYSFPVGVLLYRCRSRLPQVATSAWIVLLALAALLAFQLPALDAFPLVNIAVVDITVLILFPLLVAVAVNSEPQSRWMGVCKLLGVTSYAVYMLHPPLLAGIDWLASVFDLDDNGAAPWSGMMVMAVILGGAYLADRFYDKPVRRWLTRLADRITAARSILAVRG